MRQIAIVAAALVFGCGAKTGLPIDEVDASPPTTTGKYPCVAGSFALMGGRAELVLVLDRSGSMAENLDGEDKPPRKWDDLRGALEKTLPEFERRLDVGALAFPRRFDGTFARSCEIRRELDVEPARERADMILDVLIGTDPFGATPTADAIEFVGSVLLARRAREKTASIALATDGGPNCNIALDPNTCKCTLSTAGPKCDGRASLCLDDDRTAQSIAKLAKQGIPTFVIGLDSTALPDERGALEAMARAGGRPSSGKVPYYSVRDPAAVTEAFRTVQRSVVECRRYMPSAPDNPRLVTVSLAGASVPHDPTHTNGWDWVSVDYGQLDFFGPACDQLVRTGVAPVANVPACAP